MNNGLSQNEIDALLAGVDETDIYTKTKEESFTSNTLIKDKSYEKSEMINLQELLQEGLSIGFTALQDTVEESVVVTDLKLNLKDSDKILSKIKDKIVLVKQNVKGAINGNLKTIIEEKRALQIVEKILEQDSPIISELTLNALAENFNMIFKRFYEWLEKSYNVTIDSDTVTIDIKDNPLDIDFESRQSIHIEFSLKLGERTIPMDIVLPVTLGKEMINISLKGKKGEYEVQVEQKETKTGKQITSRPVQFSRLEEVKNKSPFGNIELLLDVSMEVTVELGRTKRRIREILGLGEGSIIELQKLAGEAVDILVNGKLIAKGEVVVIDEYFGVRITEIISPTDLIKMMTKEGE
ncbi:MAG TPA: flagellar motor switch protein FliN [Spirochaetota bacterium]|nr:flagellar motor switch protein FliN [Spirochaetota bacterium]HOM38698.1 flagellar motor switch protein FliN [Spirochaetota bacterium]HPQ49786.1 flagellar motor switch protein FliN [Spirochaetota bacterium]